MKEFEIEIQKSVTYTHHISIKAVTSHAATQQAAAIAETYNFKSAESSSSSTTINCSEVKVCKPKQ